MTDKELRDVTTEIQSILSKPGMVDNPRGTPYYIMRGCDIDEDTTVQLVFSVCKYKNSRKHYYGIYSIVEIAGGDNISDSEWDFTEDCKRSSLTEALKELRESLPDNELEQIYRDYMKVRRQKMADILQFAVDVEDDGEINEDKIMEILHDAGVIVYGAAWKARWTHEGYAKCEPPISSD